MNFLLLFNFFASFLANCLKIVIKDTQLRHHPSSFYDARQIPCKITSFVFISKRYGIVDEKSPRADKNNKQTARKTRNNHFQTLISEIFPALEGASKIFSAFYLRQLYATVVRRRRKFVRSREFPSLCALLNGISST